MDIGSPEPRMGSSDGLFYRFPIGKFRATVVSDGPIPFGSDFVEMFPSISSDEIKAILNRSFLPTDHMILEQNSLVVDTGDRVMLFDTGSGDTRTYSPNNGALMASLAAAGVPPESLTDVVLSHAHWDHCWGLVASDGTPNFANARVHIAKREFDFWTDETLLERDDWVAQNCRIARENLLPYHNRLCFFEDGEEIIPGVTAIATPGHTVGHAVYVIESEGERLCFVGDMVHHPVILLERPDATFSFDTDTDEAVRSRQRVLARLADERIGILGYHFPWPGIGHVTRRGSGYRFIPTPMRSIYEPQSPAQ